MNQIANPVTYQVDWGMLWNILLSVICTLGVVVGWFIKRWMNRWDDWKKDIDMQGGVVTRDIFFQFCNERQGKCAGGVKCRIDDIFEWRESMNEKGGPLTIVGHTDICERVTEKAAATFANRVNEIYRHHREWVGAQLELMSATLQNKFVEQISALRKEINHRNGGSK